MGTTNTIDREKLIKAMLTEVYVKHHTHGGEGTILNEKLFSDGFQVAIDFVKNYKEDASK
jgi:hypothetical protein